MGIFSGVRVYEEKWEEIGREALDNDDLNMIQPTAVVRPSTYGTSMMFKLRNGGGKMFIPMSNTCNIPVDTEVDVTLIRVLVLRRDGKTILRITVEEPKKEEIEEVTSFTNGFTL